MERLLSNRFDVDGAVIFVDLEDGVGIRSDYTYTINEFKRWYGSLKELDINDDELKQIFQLLNRYVATPEQLRQHRDDVRRRFNS